MNLLTINSILSFYVGDKFPGVMVKDRFCELLHVSQLKQFKRKLGLPEEYQPGQPIPRQAFEISRINSMDLAPFKREKDVMVAQNGHGIFPVGFFFPSTLTYKLVRNGRVRNRPVEILTDEEWNERTGSFSMEPNLYFPAANIQNGYLRFAPAEMRYVHMVFLHTPDVPVYGTTHTRNFAEYDPTTSVELKWNDTNCIDIMGIFLGELGINIPSAELIQLAEKAKATGQ